MTTGKFKHAWAAAPVAGVAACGGDGGGGEMPPTAVVIDITAANRDAVAHASAAGILSSSPTAALPLASASSTPQGDWHGRLMGMLRQPLLRQAATAGGREQPLGIAGTAVEPCAVSGTVSITFDDRDNNGAASVGDVLTIVFDRCHDTATDSVNGAATATYTQISTAPVRSIGARLTMSQLAAVSANHSLTLNGAMRLAFTRTSDTVETTRLTADGAVTIAVSTHLPYSDTVTLQSGYTQEDTRDASIPPPPGNSLAGRTTTTVQGRLRSAQADGLFDVVTLAGAALITYSGDAYPSGGALQIRGRNGTLVLTALSRTTVQLELDADNNGGFESTTSVAWDWLL